MFNISQEWFEVQWHLGKASVARQRGYPLDIPPGYVLVRIVAGGICGTDARFVTGNKVSSVNPNHYVTLGHEGVGVVITSSNDVKSLQRGDHVVVLPHIHMPINQYQPCSASEINPFCIGFGHTQHMGW